jgi:hypothetical protein
MAATCPLQWARLFVIVWATVLVAIPAWSAQKADWRFAQAPSPQPDSQASPPSSEPESKPESNPQPGEVEKKQPDETPASSPPPAAGAEPPPKQPTAAGAPAKDPPTSGAAKTDQPEEEREVARVPLASVQAGGLLLGRDQMIVEPTIFYTYSQNTSLIVTGFSVLPLIILGNFESQKTTTQLTTPALQLRYGLYRGLQLDFRVPVSYANVSKIRVSTENAGQVEESQHDFGLGDMSFGLTYQFLYERGWLPDLMFRLGATAPTGQSQFDIFRKIASQGSLGSAEQFLAALNSSGVALGGGRWVLSSTVNGVKALDPAILFGTVGWSYTPASNQDLIQISATPVSGGVLLNPQLVSSRLGAVNSIQASLGLAISLNNQLSVNFSFSEFGSFATTANNVKIPGSAINVGQFNFGINLAVTPATTLNFVGSMGITPDAPSMTFLMSMPVFYNSVVESAYSSVKGSLTDLFRGKPAPVEVPKKAGS